MVHVAILVEVLSHRQEHYRAGAVRTLTEGSCGDGSEVARRWGGRPPATGHVPLGGRPDSQRDRPLPTGSVGTGSPDTGVVGSFAATNRYPAPRTVSTVDGRPGRMSLRRTYPT